MAIKCPHCGGFSTKIQEISRSGARFKQIAIVCGGCSAPFGIVPYSNTAADIQASETRLKSLISDMTRRLDQIENTLRQMRR